MKYLVRVYPDDTDEVITMVVSGSRKMAHTRGVKVRQERFRGRAMVITKPVPHARRS